MHLRSYLLNPKNRNLVLIVLLGFILRLVYLIWGADIFLGSRKYIMEDTYGWTLSFINLLKKGIYSFDLTNPEAAFGRVPGFSFFWGIHYLLFGDYAYQAVAVSQMLLDTIAIILVYKITLNIYGKLSIASSAAMMYATYPFIIAWITVSYSELLANFVTILILFFLTKPDKGLKDYILIGVLCAFGFFVREFIGVLLPIAFGTILINEKGGLFRKFQKITIVLIAFLVGYSLWPLRNYLNHNRVVFARTAGGFPMYNNDFQSFRAWINAWDPDESKWLQAVTSSNQPVNFPAGIFNSKAEGQKAAELVTLARACGSSFQYWKVKDGLPLNTTRESCNAEISAGFDQLRASLIKNKPLFFFTSVPFKNLNKAIFKSDIQKGSVVKKKTAKIMSLIFFCRSLLIILGIIGILLSFSFKNILPVAGFSLAIYFLMCFIIRFLEMRNLLQADTVLLIPAAFTVFRIYSFLPWGRPKLVTLGTEH